MKIWFAVSTVFSLLLLLALTVTMTSCTREFEIDAQGKLAEVTTLQFEGKPPTRQYQVKPWEAALPEFRDLASRLLPGDRLIHTQNTTGFPLFQLEMTRLEVFRKETPIVVLRHGALRFWAVIAGISVFPLLCWAGGAFWALSGRPRSQPA